MSEQVCKLPQNITQSYGKSDNLCTYHSDNCQRMLSAGGEGNYLYNKFSLNTTKLFYIQSTSVLSISDKHKETYSLLHGFAEC